MELPLSEKPKTTELLFERKKQSVTVESNQNRVLTIAVGREPPTAKSARVLSSDGDKTGPKPRENEGELGVRGVLLCCLLRGLSARRHGRRLIDVIQPAAGSENFDPVTSDPPKF